MNIQDNFRIQNDVEFPIKSNYGEGFSFNIGDKAYITKGNYDYQNKEYRKIILRISTFGIQHYYATIDIYVDNVDVDQPTSSIGGYLGGIIIPDNYQSITLELIRKVTAKEKDDFPNRWGGYYAGDNTDAFYNEDDIITLFKELLPNMLKGKWSVYIDAYHNNYDEKYLIEY